MSLEWTLASSVLLFGKLDTYSAERPFMSTLHLFFGAVFKYWKIKINPICGHYLGMWIWFLETCTSFSVIPVIPKGHLWGYDSKVRRWAASASDKAQLSASLIPQEPGAGGEAERRVIVKVLWKQVLWSDCGYTEVNILTVLFVGNKGHFLNWNCPWYFDMGLTSVKVFHIKLKQPDGKNAWIIWGIKRKWVLGASTKVRVE